MKSNLGAHDLRLQNISHYRYEQVDGQEREGESKFLVRASRIIHGIIIPPVPRTGRISKMEIKRAMGTGFFTPMTVSPTDSSIKVMLMIRA